jgi:hypothetical protein
MNDSVSEKKVLSCIFFTDVFCSFRKSERFAVMDRCFECPQYLRFEREMDEEEEEFFEFERRLREAPDEEARRRIWEDDWRKMILRRSKGRVGLV